MGDGVSPRGGSSVGASASPGQLSFSPCGQDSCLICTSATKSFIWLSATRAATQLQEL